MKQPTAVFALAAFLSAAALGDTIYTVDDLVIIGKIREENEKRVIVVVDDGTFAIPRYRVLAIDYDYESRKARLKDDDYTGRYELALWALERGKTDEATAELRAVAGKPGVPPDALLKLALLLRNKGELKEAFQHLAEYLKQQPEDEKGAAVYEELKKTLVPQNGPAESKPAAGGAAQNTGGAEDTGSAAGNEPARPVEGLEAGGRWNLEGWGNKATVDVVEDKDGNKTLAILAPAGGRQDKVAVGLSQRTRLEGKNRLAFNAFVDGKAPVDLAVALITSQYYESRTIRLKPGWNTNVSVDLTGKDFKSRDTNWRFETSVEDLDRVRRIILLVYNYGAQANIYLDALRAE